MIYREKILSALDTRRGEFTLFESEMSAQLATYREALKRLSNLTNEQLREMLVNTDSPGALPTEEFDLAPSLVLPFNHKWSNREEARAWGYETLLGRKTFAADGSQILPSKDFSVPVAAVQVGWFENPHLPGVPYVKDAAFEILTPSEITVRTGGDIEFSEQVVRRRRYAMEVGAIKHFMTTEASRGFDAEKPPVVFFDSLLVVTFAEFLEDALRDFYVSEVTSLLGVSKQTGIPLVGYIDTSFARDLTNMLMVAFDLTDSPKLYDAPLLADSMRWGDRTPLFRCARQGILDSYGEEWRRDVGFVYMKTAGSANPSRLDIPMWVYDEGLLDYVVDTVRGEVIVGNGYPYVIEAADQTAVITSHDRESFYSTFQNFIEREGINLRVARKAISKAQRR